VGAVGAEVFEGLYIFRLEYVQPLKYLPWKSEKSRGWAYAHHLEVEVPDYDKITLFKN